MSAKVLGHILVIFGDILAPKIVPNSNFFNVKKQHDFEYHFFMIFGVLEVVFGVDFRTLGYSNMSIWCRRNTDFHKSGLPKSHSKNESPQRGENSSFGVNFGPILRAFLVQKPYHKSGKKRSGEKVGKKWSQGGLGRIGLRERELFSEPNCLLGGRGV